MLHATGQFDLGKRFGRWTSDAAHGYLHDSARQTKGTAALLVTDVPAVHYTEVVDDGDWTLEEALGWSGGGWKPHADAASGSQGPRDRRKGRAGWVFSSSLSRSRLQITGFNAATAELEVLGVGSSERLGRFAGS